MSTLVLPFGLSSREAARRLSCVGPNRLVDTPRWRKLVRALAVLADPMAIMLAIAGAAYLAFGDTVEGVVLLIALVPVLGVDIVLEARSRKALSALRASVSPRAHAIRDGYEREVPTESIVPGDVLVLREGDVVFADGRLERCEHMSLDESQLTGE